MQEVVGVVGRSQFTVSRHLRLPADEAEIMATDRPDRAS